MRVRWIHSLALLALLIPAWAAPRPAAAQRTGQPLEVLDGVRLDERPGETIPLDVVFHDEDGQAVPLSTFFEAGKPVVLNLVYHDCPMLCSIVLDRLTATLAEMAWVPGDQFELLTVSFNAIETPDLARRQKARYLEQLGKPEAAAGWHFLTGDEAAIARLTEAVGFHFRWVEARQEFAHPEALIFLSGEGKITRYLYGLEYPPRDVRGTLVEASAGTVGTPLDKIFLYCFQYDPEANSYVADAVNLMKLGGILTVLALGALLMFFWRREGRRSRDDGSPRRAPVGYDGLLEKNYE